MKNQLYGKNFYRKRDEDTTKVAMDVLKIVTDIFSIKSAVDFGCGVGTWLKCLKKIIGNDAEILGLDGDYVPKEFIVIGSCSGGGEFLSVNLESKISLKKRYDIAISLEVAEHLTPSRSESFVDDICNASDLVLFSAATKFQGGDGHINEQRLSYWVNLFDMHNYKILDIIRPLIWNDGKIPVWYRQNTVIFYNPLNIKRKKEVEAMSNDLHTNCLVDVIHPDLFEKRSRILVNPLFRKLNKLRHFLLHS